MRLTATTRLGITTLVLSIFTAGCASLSEEERLEKRSAIDAMAEDAVVRFFEASPELRSEFDEALGRAVIEMKVTKVPLVGAGTGKGVIVDLADDSRSYVTVKRLDFGGGYGVRSYKLLIAFHDAEMLAKAKAGNWKFSAGAEASAGSASAEGDTGGGATVNAYTLAEGGASATVTVRAIHMTPYLD